jgi:hypothetical protein
MKIQIGKELIPLHAEELCLGIIQFFFIRFPFWCLVFAYIRNKTSYFRNFSKKSIRSIMRENIEGYLYNYFSL